MWWFFPGLHRISHRELAGDLFDLGGLHVPSQAGEPAHGVAAVRVGRLDDAGATGAVRAHGLTRKRDIGRIGRIWGVP